METGEVHISISRNGDMQLYGHYDDCTEIVKHIKYAGNIYINDHLINGTMKVNGKEIKGIGFAFDGCHKIYILRDEQQAEQAREWGYDICNLSELQTVWRISCPLRFISSWDLTEYYVHQGEQAVFTMD